MHEFLVSDKRQLKTTVTSSCSSAPQCFVPAIQVPLWVSHHLQVQGLLALPRHPAQQRDPQVVVEAQSTPEAENAY